MGYILDSISQGLITRGLFHEAALNIFSVLILYWKKFCLARFAPKKQRSAINSAASLHHQLKRQEWPGQGGHEEHKEWHAFFGGTFCSYYVMYTSGSIGTVGTLVFELLVSYYNHYYFYN